MLFDAADIMDDHLPFFDSGISVDQDLLLRILQSVLPYYPAFRCMHLYKKQHIFMNEQVVSYISTSTKLFGL